MERLGKIARSGTDETTEKHSFSSNLINSSLHMLIAKKGFLFHVFYTVIM